jgi:hypothetical protein
LLPGAYNPSSLGSTCTLSWKPAMDPSLLNTRTVATSALSTKRSVPSTTVMRALAAPSAIEDHGAIEK